MIGTMAASRRSKCDPTAIAGREGGDRVKRRGILLQAGCGPRLTDHPWQLAETCHVTRSDDRRDPWTSTSTNELRKEPTSARNREATRDSRFWASQARLDR